MRWTWFAFTCSAWVLAGGAFAVTRCSETPPARLAPLLRTIEVRADVPAPSAMALSLTHAGAVSQSSAAGERYDGRAVAPAYRVADAPISTFSVDVDTGSYANTRRFLTSGELPPRDAVRTEEMLNYFRYDYPLPVDRQRPFSVTTDVSTTPWNPATRLLRIGIRGYDLPRTERPPANLVFLLDVLGSMNEPDKLPLVRTAMAILAERLRPADRVSIVVYAGAAGLVLPPTNDRRRILQALSTLKAGGSTAGGDGIRLAYATARAGFIAGGVNRILLATDGDFNVGTTDIHALEAMVASNRDDGITLTTLGFGTDNYNEAMMERIADVGNGNHAYIDTAMEARKVLDQEMASTLFTIAKDVKIQLAFNPAHISQYRLIGYENRLLAQPDFDDDRVDAGEIGAGHQVTAIYELVPKGAKGWIDGRRDRARRGAGDGPVPPDALATLRLRYKLPDGARSALVEQPVPAALIARAGPPRGDMAFAVAVAAFGQRLRGDTRLNGFSHAGIRRLAGASNDYGRQEFLNLSRLAEAREGDAPTRVAEPM